MMSSRNKVTKTSEAGTSGYDYTECGCSDNEVGISTMPTSRCLSYGQSIDDI